MYTSSNKHNVPQLFNYSCTLLLLMSRDSVCFG